MRISPSSLRISSLLAALKDNTDSDVIDALSYFLLPALDKVKGLPVTASLIAKAANGIYGWNITES
ncbi:hypothetical protein, partial [Paracoccus aminovorans]|uniref:hypothetical protein n=1 Tax=Paracoccus aminovorans TaxID=34004 RepID=UPI001560ABAC